MSILEISRFWTSIGVFQFVPEKKKKQRKIKRKKKIGVLEG
jgi:hypothetical protein